MKECRASSHYSLGSRQHLNYTVAVPSKATMLILDVSTECLLLFVETRYGPEERQRAWEKQACLPKKPALMESRIVLVATPDGAETAPKTLRWR
jgi:hypothetical protein